MIRDKVRLILVFVYIICDFSEFSLIENEIYKWR